MRQSGTRSRHFPDPGLRIRTARGACAPRRRRCQPERASPGIRTCSRWVADPLEIGVLRDSGLRRLAEVRTIERNRRKWPAPQPFLGFLAQTLKKSIISHRTLASAAGPLDSPRTTRRAKDYSNPRLFGPRT